MARRASRTGFTIVELLIVVVVIAILAAITIVAYNGITNRAKNSAASSAAESAAKKVMTFAVTNSDSYPATLADSGVTDGNGTTYQYRVDNTANPKTFCVTATANSVSYFVSSANATPTSGACAGHGANGVAAITNILLNPSAEAAITDIDAYGGGSTVRDTSTAESGGVASVRTDITLADRGIIFMGSTGALPSTQYWCSVAVSGTAGIIVNVSGRMLTDAKGYIGEGSGLQSVTLTSSWQRVNISFTSHSSASLGRVALQVVSSSSGVTTGSIRADRAICVRGNTISGYADGQSSGWAWNGVQYNSTSSGPAL